MGDARQAGSSRRTFLSAAAVGLGVAGLGARRASASPAGGSEARANGEAPGSAAPGSAAPGSAAPGVAVKPKAFKISLTQGSLHRELLASRFDPLDFAKVANGFGIDAIEYVSQFFPGKGAGNKAFLSELKRRAAGEGVASLLIRVDGEADLGTAARKARQRAVDSYKKWVDAAAFLGCHAIRVDASPAGGRGSEDERTNWVSDGLHRLAEFSDGRGIDVLLENQGGLSSKGSWLTEVLSAVKHPRCGSAPDFGGFDLVPASAGASASAAYDRYKGVRELMPFARAVSARAWDFDPRGDETKINYGQMLEIVTSAGYHGYVGITYTGDRLSERAGIQRAKLLLERVREQLSTRGERRG
jgi:L-ribulose-5-phosphate 3-epimerase